MAEVEAKRAARTGSQPAPSAQPSAPVWFDVYDLAAGELQQTVELPFATELIAVSPDGTRALTRIAHDQDRLDVWSIEDGQPVVAWRPYQHEAKERDRKTGAAMFVDSDHVLTINNGKPMLWELPACRAVYEIDRVWGAVEVSPGGQYLACIDQQSVKFYDARTGQPQGELATELRSQAIAFHPAGTRFAAVVPLPGNTANLTVWNLQSGQLETAFVIPKVARSMHWCGDGHLLLDGRSLVDLKSQMLVWTYQLPKGLQASHSPDGRHWFVAPTGGGGSDMLLAAATLPDSQTASNLARTTLKPETVMGPGSRISLQINLANPPGVANFQNDVRKNLTAKLAQHQIAIADGQPIRLTLSMSESSTGETMELRSIGPGSRGTTTVAKRKITGAATFTHGNEKLLELPFSTSNDFFGITTIPEGKSVEQHLNEQMWKAATNHFLNFKPPRYIFGPNAANGLGQSQLTAELASR